jgi:hypothetical protein
MAPDTDTQEFGPFPEHIPHTFDWEMAQRLRSDDDQTVEKAVAVAYRYEDDGYVTAFTFATTTDGVVDLVGFDVQWSGSERGIGTARHLADLEAQRKPDAPAGLTSRRVRTAAMHAGLLAEAREQLRDYIMPWIVPPGMRSRRPTQSDGLTDEFYASVVLEYESLISKHGRGARQLLAERRHRSDATVRNWIEEAKRRGLWATAGRGRTGQPTLQARQLGQEN